ncbi:recombinase family protein [Paenibacillus bouchesdurhonensis]|uniref:recombinase family protein n=1 Tax=Paenibacillus bouchesdurhonensis TaxID=1870990 RepID=UPI000DA60363|nr:recombinase family protein [Paenibacillus bouchesdurhonensis]
MRVLGYPRVSTEEQAEKGNSLTEQMERMTAYCKAMGWDEPIFFIEDGYSAKNLNRPEITRMLDYVKKNAEGGIVLTTKLDRLSRKLFDILSLNEYFNKHNYNFVSATEGFDTSTPAGRLVLQMLGMVAEFERERTSERVRDNMLSIARNIKNNKKIITRPCFGYDVKHGEMVFNIEESLLIKKAAADLISGIPSRRIIQNWNMVEGVKTKDGNEWSDKTFRELFQRETLVGDFVYNKTYKEGTKVITRPEEEWIRIEDNHPAILDRDTFERLQALFQSRKTVGKHMSNDRYLLSGLVVCGHCGNKMNGKMNRSYSKRNQKENIHYQYLCDGYLKKSNCYHHYVKRDMLETLIVNEIISLSESAPGKLKILISETKEKTLDINIIKSKLAKLDKKMQKQIDAYNDDLITAHDLKIATERVQGERRELECMLEVPNNGQEKKEERVIHKAKKEKKYITSEDRLVVKQSIRKLIDKIEIMNGEEVVVTWLG